ncbi:Polyketide cyclase/dehydrase [Hyphomicrobium denitrificans ATCC 51888]|uniref:Polyketide cyclase/dehydrase n=1 Tax=Hyphomicrobium denitrificans (strain ATCC 51888 / DSM 1869 / NCIMB 11706 / TK 0415) TaxID=582899 RepID=D8JX51_HYPDA|nr:SRPBCC family protein [Hyphomicrobium denitrificans]ADJ23187.1 Polyketide cyclase/dehydrase [Hyphomicrobium denitrificans ATCC 51888]
MKFFQGLAVAGVVALAGGFAGSAANAASIAVGKKLELKVDAKKMDEERTRLWTKFGGWCALKDWHPAVANCEESTEGDAKIRVLTLKDGGKIKEKLLDEKPNFYRYEILESPLPVKNYQAQFALTPDDDDEDEINFAWSATFDANGKTNKEAHDVIDGIFTAGLDNIKATAGTK